MLSVVLQDLFWNIRWMLLTKQRGFFKKGGNKDVLFRGDLLAGDSKM